MNKLPIILTLVLAGLSAAAQTVHPLRVNTNDISANVVFTNIVFTPPQVPMVTNLTVSSNIVTVSRDDGHSWRDPASPSLTTNLVNSLVDSGEVCRIKGHIWEVGCGVPSCAAFHHDSFYHCRLCRKRTAMKMVESK